MQKLSKAILLQFYGSLLTWLSHMITIAEKSIISAELKNKREEPKQ